MVPNLHFEARYVGVAPGFVGELVSRSCESDAFYCPRGLPVALRVALKAGSRAVKQWVPALVLKTESSTSRKNWRSLAKQKRQNMRRTTTDFGSCSTKIGSFLQSRLQVAELEGLSAAHAEFAAMFANGTDSYAVPALRLDF